MTSGQAMLERTAESRWRVGVGLLFLVPMLHPLLIPVVGSTSHLLWFVHVLPVALLTFHGGRGQAAVTLLVSSALIMLGEGLFGGGYGVSAEPAMTGALTVALLGTNVFVVSFALYARKVSRRYQLLFDRIRLGIIRVDSADRIVGLNPAAATLLRVDDPKSLKGRSIASVMRVAELTSLRDLETRVAWSGQLDIHGLDSDRSIHALLTAASDPRSGGYQIFIADRTIEAMQQQELERQTKLSTLGEALAGVAHELNNPLASIMAHSQLGQMGPADDTETAELFDVITRESKRMRDLVAELVGFSRPRGEVACADVDDLLERIVRVQRIILGSRVPIVAELSSDATVRVSALKIEQIVLNLISNAAYAVHHGGTAITVSSWREGDTVWISVQDDGPGISEEICDRLFEPFATTKPEGEGTGLGLAISRRLARAWGGDLVAGESQSGGATFSLRLPFPEECQSCRSKGSCDRGCCDLPHIKGTGDASFEAAPQPTSFATN